MKWSRFRKNGDITGSLELYVPALYNSDGMYDYMSDYDTLEKNVNCVVKILQTVRNMAREAEHKTKRKLKYYRGLDRT